MGNPVKDKIYRERCDKLANILKGEVFASYTNQGFRIKFPKTNEIIPIPQVLMNALERSVKEIESLKQKEIDRNNV